MDKNNNNSFENYEKRIEEEFENSTIFNSSNTEFNKKKKHKNNSYVKLLCALLCLLIIVGSGIFSVIRFWPKTESEVETTTVQPSINLTADADIELAKMKNIDKNAVSNVSKIVVQNETDKFVCTPYKTTEKDEDGDKTEQVYFKLSGIDKSIPIDNTLVTNFRDAVFSVKAVSKLEDKWKEKDCGLDKPKIFVKVTMADKSEFIIKIGNQVATSDGYYYVSTSLKDGIYIADSEVYESFSSDLNSLVNLTLFDAIKKNDNNSDYFLNDKLAVYDSITLSGSNFKSQAKLSYHQSDDDVMVYHIDEPVKTYASNENIETLLSPLSDGISASSVYKLNPNLNDFRKYGLDKPYLEVRYRINNKDYNIKFSKPGKIDNNYSACVVNDIPVIYSILCEQVSFLEWNLNNLRYNLLYLKNIETIKSLTANYNGKSYKYELSFDAVKDDSDESSSTDTEEKELTVVMNSAPIDAENFKTAYQRITMASATKYLEANQNINEKPVLSFDIKLQNGKTDRITYTKYNQNYYLHKLNGIGDELIPARIVESLITNYERLRKGEEVISPNNQQ